MAEDVNPHYDKVIDNMGSKKDSIFESCRVMEFDTKTLMAKVRGIRSKSVKKNVIVLFPSMYLNTGHISFPVKDSVGLCFVGVDNESYMLPAQFFPPIKESERGVVKSNASPSQFDELLSLENLEPGEQLLRSLSGAQVYIRNTGEVEIATSKMHRLSLNELEGALEVVIERKREHIGFSEHFDGAYDPKEGDDSTDHHIYSKYHEKVPNWETDEVLSKDIVKRLMDADVPTEELFPLEEELPIAEKQMVNVFESNSDKKKKSTVDNADLFYDFNLFQNVNKLSKGRFKANLSKSGALQISSFDSDGRGVANVEMSTEKGVTLKYNGGTSVTVTPGNEIIINDRKGSYTLSHILDRLEALERIAHSH